MVKKAEVESEWLKSNVFKKMALKVLISFISGIRMILTFGI